MGKITSMHFAGWKMGLKTGMYYLRTQAAAAPIQFTVDQAALKVDDATVARDRPLKKRAPPSGSSFMTSQNAVPRTNVGKDSAGGNEVSSNGMPTPSTTPPPALGVASKPRVVESPNKPVPMKADVPEGNSPKTLPTEPADTVEDEELRDATKKSNQTEDNEDADRERDIYSDAVVACK
jgi:ribonucleoside-diphosphate reductase subunit M1